MKRTMIAASSAVLMLSLAACGNGTNTPNASSTPSPAVTSTIPAEPAQSTQAPVTTPEPSAIATEQPSPSPSPSASPEEQTVALTYRMTKAYRIVPIDKDKTPSKVALLTFDDGPKEEATLKPLLDTLDKHHAKAIFFVNGYRVKAHPELLKEIDERGQVIGNHSWDHIELGKEKPEKVKEQIGKVQDIVKEVTGKTPIFFRPPFASGNDSVHQIAKDYGLLYMTWSNGSLDWDMSKIKLEKRPQAVIDNVMDQLHEGSNILMHELPWTGETLDNLLTQLEQKGYSFVDPNAIDPTK
ncbi:polysaccharide deacetylase family protein [Cohnella yongneupensis]|uniref:Polysaccharide deacetylase family protein n=1 Tax=Cohnella yongneupensis TaxID=425006 RepID=A0ABW0R4S3_9BACL